MSFDLSTWAILIPAVMIAGISKGGFGASVGFLATPLMALAISPVLAAAILFSAIGGRRFGSQFISCFVGSYFPTTFSSPVGDDELCFNFHHVLALSRSRKNGGGSRSAVLTNRLV